MRSLSLRISQELYWRLAAQARRFGWGEGRACLYVARLLEVISDEVWVARLPACLGPHARPQRAALEALEDRKR